MKIRDKILTTLLSLCLSVSIYADKKEDDIGTNDPPPPPPNVQDEVENNPSPEDLQEQIDDLKDENEDLKKDLESASRAIKSLVEERSDLIEDIKEMGDALDRGPGSLFKGWVYSPKLKWVYVSPTIVPYSYSQEDGWMLYEYGTNPRRVYYYKTKEWKLLDNEE